MKKDTDENTRPDQPSTDAGEFVRRMVKKYPPPNDYRVAGTREWEDIWSLCKYITTQQAHIEGLNKLLEEDLVIMQSEFVADTCTCTEKDGSKILDSCAVSSRADAMRFLAERGLIIIEKEAGRRIIGKWAEQAKEKPE